MQNQVSKATIVDGKINVKEGTGQCNASALTTLLNRRLAYDGNYSSSTRFRINDVFAANGVILKYEDEKRAQTGQKGYRCYVFDNNKDTGGWAESGKKYSNQNNSVTYTVRSISGGDWKNKSNNPEGITDFYEYIVYLLMQHPEGICVRNSKATHVAVIVDYERVSGGKIQLYVKDPAIRTDNGKSYEDTKKLEEAYIYTHDSSKYDLESGFQFFTYLEGSRPVSPCGGNHTGEYFDRGINKCMICNRYNYSKDNSIDIKDGSYTVIDEGTRLREGPYDNDTSVTLEQIPGGAEVTVIQAVENVFGNTWYKVSYNGKTGFVFYEKLLYAGMRNPYSYGSYSGQMKNGSKGSSVKYLQQALNVVMNSGLTVDGQFGNNTKTAVKAFQKKYGLTQDGIFGKNSNAKMEELLKEMGYGTDGKPMAYKEPAAGHKTSQPAAAPDEGVNNMTETIQNTADEINETATDMMVYNITYNANGGSSAPGSQEQQIGSGVSISDVIPVRDGYTFEGWASSPNGSVAYMPNDWYSDNESITLYAVWKKAAPAEKNPYDYGSYNRQLQYRSSMMRGDDVKFLQQALNIVMNSGLDVDGIFGGKTKQAVKDFQSKYGLDVDGIYGKKSNAKMESLLSEMGFNK